MPDEPVPPPLPLLVAQGVARTLALAETWLAWDGVPRRSDGGERIYTPTKVIRRCADHLVDHLAEIEALLAGEDGEPDRWHASAVTLASDWAPFSEADLNEACERLRRLARLYELRLASLASAEWDAPRPGHGTLREIVEHVSQPWYAEQLGDLSVDARSWQHVDDQNESRP